MVISLHNPARLLTDTGLLSALAPIVAPIAPAVGTRRVAITAPQTTLRVVAMALAVDDDPNLYRDLFSQLDAAQRLVDALPEHDAETGHLEHVLDALPLSGEPAAELCEVLAEYECFLQREARLDEALQVLALGARACDAALTLQAFAAYALRAGRLNRLLTRWDQATACYTAAAEAGQLLHDDGIMLRSRLGRGAVYRGQGELAAARASAEIVMREAERLGFLDVHAVAYWDIGVILRLEGVLGEALEAVSHASQVLRDPDDRLYALRDVGLVLTAVRAFDRSRVTLETVRDVSGDALLRTSALIGLMSVESAVGDRFAFERWRDAADNVRARMPPGMAVAHRYKLGEGLVRFGQWRRAYAVFNEALALARANRLYGWCSEIACRLDVPVAKAG